MLADRRRDLVEVSLRRPIRCRLYLVVTLSMLEIGALSHLLRAVDRVVNLKVLQGNFLRMRCLLGRLLQVDVRVFRALQSTLCILGAFLSDGVAEV